jgi:hypothetical protein
LDRKIFYSTKEEEISSSCWALSEHAYQKLCIEAKYCTIKFDKKVTTFTT